MSRMTSTGPYMQSRSQAPRSASPTELIKIGQSHPRENTCRKQFVDLRLSPGVIILHLSSPNDECATSKRGRQLFMPRVGRLQDVKYSLNNCLQDANPPCNAFPCVFRSEQNGVVVSIPSTRDQLKFQPRSSARLSLSLDLEPLQRPVTSCFFDHQPTRA